ncbi:MAG: hypothetical protein M3376_11705 [Actinomycetota bacterium]|nr:hypothetical protein [Actinomycetota bacterium]
MIVLPSGEKFGSVSQPHPSTLAWANGLLVSRRRLLALKALGDYASPIMKPRNMSTISTPMINAKKAGMFRGEVPPARHAVTAAASPRTG